MNNNRKDTQKTQSWDTNKKDKSFGGPNTQTNPKGTPGGMGKPAMGTPNTQRPQQHSQQTPTDKRGMGNMGTTGGKDQQKRGGFGGK